MGRPRCGAWLPPGVTLRVVALRVVGVMRDMPMQKYVGDALVYRRQVQIGDMHRVDPAAVARPTVQPS